MLDKKTKNKIFKIFIENMDAKNVMKLKEEHNLVEDLGFDSMTLIKVAIQIEDVIGVDLIDLPDSDMSLYEIQTIGDVFKIIESAL